jgi:IS5 family transposase
MKPRVKPQDSGVEELFRSKLKNIISMRHELVWLAGLIDWARPEAHFAPYYSEAGRPRLPIRLVVGLHLLKHIEGLSDEGVCERWERDLHMQYFCGEEYFQHSFPLERSGMTHFRRRDPGYLYSWQATEVECISKGKARAPYEFGCKVSLATNLHPAKGGHFILHAQALHGNPYDGHTPAAALEDIRKIVGRAPQRVAVDQGYKQHRIALPYTAVYITGRRRGVTEKIKRWLKRRAVVEPVIGHAKNDGLLGRNWLGGRSGDRSNALLAAVGFNLRQLLRFLKRSKLFLYLFLQALLADLTDCGSPLSQEAAHSILTPQNYSALHP